MKLLILDHAAIEARIRRMAHEIYERNYTEQAVYIIGVEERGGYLADRLTACLREISPLRVTQARASLDRTDRAGMVRLVPMKLSVEMEALHNHSAIVVDDVLYGGNTMLNVVAGLLPALPKSIQTAVLIDRGHRLMPIAPNFVGLELATSLQQHVSFEVLPNGDAAAYLA